MAELHDIYQKAIDGGMLNKSVSEERFGKILQDDKEREDYYNYVKKKDPNFYSSDYAVFSQNAAALFSKPAEQEGHSVFRQILSGITSTPEKQIADATSVQLAQQSKQQPVATQQQQQKPLLSYSEIQSEIAEKNPAYGEFLRSQQEAKEYQDKVPMFEEAWVNGDKNRLDSIWNAAQERAAQTYNNATQSVQPARPFIPAGSVPAFEMRGLQLANQEKDPALVMQQFEEALDQDYSEKLATLNESIGTTTTSPIPQVQVPLSDEELAAKYAEAGIMSPEDYNMYRRFVREKMNEYFVDMNVPKDRIDYFTRKFIQGNLIAQLGQLATVPLSQRQLQNQGVEKYEQEHDDWKTKGTAFGAEVANIVTDPLMWLAPGAGNVVSRSIVGGLARRQLEKSGISGAAGVAERLMAQRGALRTAQRLTSGAITFAGIDAGHDLVGQLYQTGKVEPAEIGKSIAKGAATGALFGSVGMFSEELQHAIGRTYNKTVGAIAGKSAQFVGGTNVFVASSVVPQLAEGKRLEDIDWGTEYMNAAAMQLFFDVKSGLEVAIGQRSFSKAWEHIKADPLAGNFTQEEFDQFNAAGIEGRDAYTILKNLNGGKDMTSYDDAYLLDIILKNENIDTQAKYKLGNLLGYGGRVAREMRNVFPIYVEGGEEQDANGRYIVRVYDNGGMQYETRYFGSKQAAEAWKRRQFEQTRNNMRIWQEGVVRDAAFFMSMQSALDGAIAAVKAEYPQYTEEEIGNILAAMTAENKDSMLDTPEIRAIYNIVQDYIKNHLQVPDLVALTIKETAGDFKITEDDLKEILQSDYKDLSFKDRSIFDGYLYRLAEKMPESTSQRSEEHPTPPSNIDGQRALNSPIPTPPTGGEARRAEIRKEVESELVPRLAEIAFRSGDMQDNPVIYRVADVGNPERQGYIVAGSTTPEVDAESNPDKMLFTNGAATVTVRWDNEAAPQMLTLNDLNLLDMYDTESRIVAEVEQRMAAQEEVQGSAPSGTSITPDTAPVIEKEKPNLDLMTADELGAATVEYLEDKQAAVQWLTMQLEQAKKEAARVSNKRAMFTDDIDEFKRQNAAVQRAKREAQAVVSKLEAAINAASAYKTAEERAEAERAEAARKAKYEARRKTEEAMSGSAPAEKWNSIPREVGNAATRTLPDGTKISGHYVLAEAGTATASHDPFNSWNTSNGFPTTEDGRNINDRDYKNDKDAQSITEQIARTYDGQAVEQVPVVSNEGIVYDGNGRTIAGNIAAANNTDQAYLQALAENAHNFGFTEEQLKNYQHPRVYLQLDENLPYSTQTFAQFNQQEKKSQSSANRAVANSKKLTESARDGILQVINDYATLDSFFQSETGAKDVIASLLDNGIITQQEVAGLTEATDKGFLLSPAGKDAITDLLIGALFDEQTIRMLGNDKGLKQSILRALPSIVENRKLEEYALTDNIREAIQLLYEARQAGMAYNLYVLQGNAFDGYVSERFSPFSMLLAEEMTSGVEEFRQVLNLYNNSAKDEVGGQGGLFEPRTTEDIKNEILNYYGREAKQPTEGQRVGDTQAQPAVPGIPASAGQEEVVPGTEGKTAESVKQSEQNEKNGENILPNQEKSVSLQSETVQNATEWTPDRLEAELTEEEKLELLDRINDGRTPYVLTGFGDIRKELEKRGIKDATIQYIEDVLSRSNQTVKGFFLQGLVYLNNDAIKTGVALVDTYVHERQHLLTRTNPVFRNRIEAATSIAEMAPALEVLAGTDYYTQEYGIKKQNLSALADEFISHVMATVYSTGRSVEEVCAAAGFSNEEVINTLKELDNGQRKSNALSQSRRDSILSRSSQGRSGQDGRDNRTGEGRGLEQQSDGTSQESPGRVGGREQVTPFKDTRLGMVAAEFKRQHPDENVGIIFREKDTYELYDEDAVKAGKILGKDVAQKDGIPFLSFPVNDLKAILGQLIRGGMKIGITRKPDHKPTKGDYQIGDTIEYNGKTAIIKDFTFFGTAILDVDGRQVEMSREDLDAILDEQETTKTRAIEVEAGGALVSQLEEMGVPVSTDLEANREALKKAKNDKSEAGKIHYYKTQSGEQYGFSYKGRIYLDPRKVDAELPIHEYGHLWSESFRRLNPTGWQNVVEVIKRDADAWAFVRSLRPELTDENDIVEEIIATYSGQRGAEKLRKELERMAKRDKQYESKWQNIFANVSKAIQDFWKAVGDFLHIRYESAEQVYDQVLKDFVNRMNPRQRIENYLKERDAEYMAAAESGDMARASQIFEEALQENIGNGITPYVSVGQYNDLRRLARGVKTRNKNVIAEAARMIAPLIPDNAVLVPAPSHTGVATDMLDLSNAIAAITGSEVADVLKGAPRESQYATKKQTGAPLSSREMGIVVEGQLPAGKLPVVIDNVVDSGNTAEACVNALGKGIVVSLANSADMYRHAASLKSAAPVLRDRKGNIVPLSQRFETNESKYLGRIDAMFSIEGTGIVPINGKTLVGLHNINSEKLRKVIKAGGLANPSAAVIDLAKQDHHDYGEISLVLPSDMVEHAAGTYAGDAWTPTYPHVEYKQGKDTEKRIEDAVKGLPVSLADGIYYRVGDYMSGNRYTSGLEYIFLKNKGEEMPIQTNKRHYPDISIEEVYRRLGLEYPGYFSSDAYEAYEKLPEDQVFDYNLWFEKYGKEAEIQRIKDKISELREEGEDKAADALTERYSKPLFFNYFDSIGYRILKDERDAGEENIGATLDAAANRVDELGLRNEFDEWQRKMIDSFGYDEVLFAGWTPSGNKRYLPNTVENASRLMNKNSETNYLERQSVNETKAMLMDKFKTLAQIRKHRNILENDEEKIREAYEQVSSDWAQLGIDFRDYTTNEDKTAYGLDDNQFIAIDNALSRLQEAMLKSDPIAFLNREYRYSLPADSEFGTRLAEMVQRIKNLPSRYFETKFRRPVYLNEFAAAVVPNNLADDLKKGLRDNGLPLYEYDSKEIGSRREATLLATDSDGIRFSIGGVRGAENMDKANEVFERYDEMLRAAQNNAERGYIMRDFLNNHMNADVLHYDICFNDDEAMEFLTEVRGMSQDQAKKYLDKQFRDFVGVYDEGYIFIWGNKIANISDLHSVYVHENQHKRNELLNFEKERIILSSTPEELARFLRDIHNGKNHYDFLLEGKNEQEKAAGFEALADEVLAHGVQICYMAKAGEDIKQVLIRHGITNETVIQEIYDELERHRRERAYLGSLDAQWKMDTRFGLPNEETSGAAGRNTGGQSENAAKRRSSPSTERGGGSGEELERLRALAIAHANNIRVEREHGGQRYLFAGREPQIREVEQPMFSISGNEKNNMTRIEVITRALVEQSKYNYQLMHAALKQVGSSLNELERAMQIQADFDKNQVAALLNLTNTLMRSEAWGNNLRQSDIGTIFTQIRNAVGKKDISREVKTIMRYLVNAQRKAAQRQWNDLLQTKIQKLNISGVVSQGKVALQGQYAMQALKYALSRQMTVPQLEEQISELSDAEMNAGDNSIKEQLKGRMIGYVIAAQHIERTQDLQQESLQLENEWRSVQSDKKYKPAAKRQLEDAIQQSIQENILKQADAFIQSSKDLQEYIENQHAAAKGYIDRINANREKIRNYAAKDLAGTATNPNRLRTRSQVARLAWEAISSPIRDLQSLLRMVGMHAPDGEGYLYNHFMRGWIDAADEERRGIVSAQKTLDEKVKELTNGKYQTWLEAAQDVKSKSHKMLEVEMLNGDDGYGKPVTEPLSIDAGNALYVYAVNKMLDGKMKLRAMNISEEDVEALKNAVREQLGQELINLVDWVQSEFFVSLRNRYNPTHEALFGAPMDEIENYFPLRINPNGRQKNEDLGDPDTDASRLLTGTSTGSIKRRIKNLLGLDVRNADFFQEVIRHVAQMERWNAFAQWTRDANILFSDINFRNRVKGLNTIYGTGDELYNYMKDAFKAANGTYRPKTSKPGEVVLNIAKGVTSAKINFRLFTALKQLASFPAFFTYMTDGEFVNSYVQSWAHPHDTMHWAKATLPNFEKRVSKRDMGDMRLMQRTTDWQWLKHTLDWSSKYGMYFNVLFDTLTCATGARAVYESHKADYLRKGYSAEDAERRAVQDAEQAFNTSQQSSEGAFMAPIQLDRDLATSALMVYRTSSMQYTRNFIYHTRNLLNKMKAGTKAEQIAFRIAQYKADGLNEEQATQAAIQDYNKSIRSDAIGFVVYGALLNIVWRFFAQVPYLVMGDDDDKKKDALKQIVTGGALVSPLTGLLGGSIVEQALDGYGDIADIFSPDMPFTQDVRRVSSYLKNEQYAEAASQALSVLMQSVTGFDPQTAAEVVMRTMTTLDSEADLDAAEKAWQVTSAVFSISQGQYEQLLVDRVMADEGQYDAVLEDYTRYKLIQTAPLAWYLRSEDAVDRAAEAAQNRLDKLIEERQKLTEDDE